MMSCCVRIDVVVGFEPPCCCRSWELLLVDTRIHHGIDVGALHLAHVDMKG